MSEDAKPGLLRRYLNMKEKKEIAEFMTSNGHESMQKVALIFSERYGRFISRQAVWRLKKIMTELVNTPTTSNGRVKKRSEHVEQFEEDLYSQISCQMTSTPVTYGTAKSMAMKLQTSEQYQEVEEIKKLRFSEKWWRNFKRDRNIGLQKIVDFMEYDADQVTVKIEEI